MPIPKKVDPSIWMHPWVTGVEAKMPECELCTWSFHGKPLEGSWKLKFVNQFCFMHCKLVKRVQKT